MERDAEDELREFLRALASPERLRVAGTLAGAAETLSVAEVAARAGLPPRVARAALAALAGAGLAAVEEPERYRLDGAHLRALAARLLASPVSQARAAATDERARVLASFFRDGRLLKLPTGDRRRAIVLEEIATAFTPDRAYPEREVNDILRRYHDDYATLRRYLVDLRYLTRASGIYHVLRA